MRSLRPYHPAHHGRDAGHNRSCGVPLGRLAPALNSAPIQTASVGWKIALSVNVGVDSAAMDSASAKGTSIAAPRLGCSRQPGVCARISHHQLSLSSIHTNDNQFQFTSSTGIRH
jgi:hypothetical protein